MSEMNIGSRLDSYITNVSLPPTLLTHPPFSVHNAMGKKEGEERQQQRSSLLDRGCRCPVQDEANQEQ
jgi:hypothetical protein